MFSITALNNLARITSVRQAALLADFLDRKVPYRTGTRSLKSGITMWMNLHGYRFCWECTNFIVTPTAEPMFHDHCLQEKLARGEIVRPHTSCEVCPRTLDTIVEQMLGAHLRCLAEQAIKRESRAGFKLSPSHEGFTELDEPWALPGYGLSRS